MVLSNKKLKQKVRAANAELLAASESELKRNSTNVEDPNPKSLKSLLDSVTQKSRLSKRDKRREKTLTSQEEEEEEGGPPEQKKGKNKKRKRHESEENGDLKTEKKPIKKKKKKKKKKKNKGKQSLEDREVKEGVTFGDGGNGEAEAEAEAVEPSKSVERYEILKFLTLPYWPCFSLLEWFYKGVAMLLCDF
ncbi:hypothetical protein A4A49_14644 [Nicotiana attenuata]|uniref:Uncharacterized protein n=1 Tax=Nicotiana attenuata TaxID=49451 RepID=A0A314L0Y6_NICAT|nr:hypothetical protein A4A49_14644 [Nicotiana attenuata]